MKLDTEFRKLPLRFDAERLAAELDQFGAGDWRAHPQGHAGNTAVPLIAVEGDPANDAVKGPMRPTPLLERCPYVRQVLAALGAVLGRTRLMRIVGQGEAHAHVDTNYYWLQRVRVHVPIVTSPKVQFVCGGRALHMAPGETWIFDTWRLHNVLNPDSRDRVHLVADTVGSASFWDLAAQAERPFADDPSPPTQATFVPFVPESEPALETETVNFPVVMSPWEQECLIVRILEDLGQSERTVPELAIQLEATLERFHRQWRALWARHGEAATGWSAFRELLRRIDGEIDAFAGRLALPNELEVVEALRQAIVRPALNPELASAETPRKSEGEKGRKGNEDNGVSAAPVTPRPGPVHAVSPSPLLPFSPSPTIDRPIFIVAAPRSGSTFLFETLARSSGVWTVGGESHEVFETIAKLNPVRRGCDSNRLTAADYDAETAATLRARFLALLRDRNGRPLPSDAGPVRLLEKTPKNALRVPFLDAVFPDALFIYLYREPHENISSILEAWKSGGFVTYPRLPGWEGPPWSMLLIPRWRRLRGQPLPKIAAAQWATANRTLLDDLEQLPPERWCMVSYADLVANPQVQVERLCQFAGIAWDQELRGPLPLSRYTLTPPDPNKWRKNAAALEPLLPRLEPLRDRARQVLARTVYRLPIMTRKT
jgi:hypothetical protein